MSRNAICKAIDLDPGVMSRYMNGKCGLAMGTLDRLVEFLDLQITKRKGRRRRKA